MIVVAFDPGKLASWALFDTSRPQSMRMGEVELIGSGRLLRPCPIHITEIISCADSVIVEEVGARPKQGVSSMFTFGLAVGTILGTVSAHQKQIELVAPTDWKKSSKLGGLSGVDAKRAALARAKELWPEHHETFRKEANHGQADAALMARWYFLDGPGRAIELAEDSAIARDAAPAPRKASRKTSKVAA